MEDQRSTACTHHWILGEAHMASVEGVCRRCGARRTYPSGIELSDTVPQYGEPDPGLATPTRLAASVQEQAAA